jgi:hypothetical protein
MYHVAYHASNVKKKVQKFDVGVEARGVEACNLNTRPEPLPGIWRLYSINCALLFSGTGSCTPPRRLCLRTLRMCFFFLSEEQKHIHRGRGSESNLLSHFCSKQSFCPFFTRSNRHFNASTTAMYRRTKVNQLITILKSQIYSLPDNHDLLIALFLSEAKVFAFSWHY